MANDTHYFRVKFENDEEEFWGWSGHKLRSDYMARQFAREQEEKNAKIERREPRKIASVERIFPAT